MSKKMSFAIVAAACVGILASATVASALSITQTTNGTALGNALGGGGGLTIDSVAVTNGHAKQFGTYTGFTSGLVTIGDGIVLSTGKVVQTTAASNNGVLGTATTPSTDTGADAVDTAAFDGYGALGHITNFTESYDVAVLNVDFTLSAASHVGFDFIFGSVEYPEYTSKYADAFLAFLDGRAAGNQIVFDADSKTVQVGNSFERALRTDDTNTAFAAPHGLLKLETYTQGVLSVGSHSISFQIGDVNDRRLDSAVFISNFRAGDGPGDTNPPPPLPEPSSLLLLGASLVALAAWRRKVTA
jgi:PEP-CTERM motif